MFDVQNARLRFVLFEENVLMFVVVVVVAALIRMEYTEVVTTRMRWT
jgi:hypothetical protein